MPRCHSFLVLAATALTLAAQDGAPKPEPVKLVSDAEKLLKAKETESAVLLLWQALEQLATLPPSPVHDAAALSARFLLTENDPREAERRRVFASVARQHVELAAQYRSKKWLDAAASRLDVADRFDRDVTTKERAALEAAKPKAKVPAAPPAVAPVAERELAPLLQRAGDTRVFGEWEVVGDCLATGPQTGKETFLHEWMPAAQHGDHELSFEWKPADPTKEHNGGLWIGYDEGREGLVGYRASFYYVPSERHFALRLRAPGAAEDIAFQFVTVPPTADGFHRFLVQVRGVDVRVQIDDAPGLDARLPTAVTGRTGLLSGISDATSCALLWRAIRIDQLPADRPTEEDVRAAAEQATQEAITKAVGAAKELVAKKQHEAASLQLREALRMVDELPAGVLTDNLRKTIEPLLAQADPLTARRTKTAQTVAAELGALADFYTKAGMARAALVLAEHAAGFDPKGRAAHVAAAREAVAQWNLAQAGARAAELAPPADDGTVLREWFAKGRKLDTRGAAMIVDGAAARADTIEPGGMVGWLPQPLAPALTKAAVHVHLPTAGVGGGLCFDVVDSSSFGIAVLQRRAKGLRLAAFLKTGTKWLPLLQRDVALDAWRLDGWHELIVESTATGLTARCGNVVLEIPRKLLGKPTGLFGLYADNATHGAASVELRAFRTKFP